MWEVTFPSGLRLRVYCCDGAGITNVIPDIEYGMILCYIVCCIYYILLW